MPISTSRGRSNCDHRRRDERKDADVHTRSGCALGAFLRRIPPDVRAHRRRPQVENSGLRGWAGELQHGSDPPRHGRGVLDPLYRYDVSQIRERIAATCDQVLEQTRQNADEFVWDTIASVEQLGTVRMAAMQAFLDDYDGRPTAGEVHRRGTADAAVSRPVLRPRRLLALSLSVHEPAHRSVSPGVGD